MNRSELVKTLELVKPALAANNLVPIFTCFVFETKQVYAYNDSLGIVAKCDVDESSFAVNGTTLLELLKNSGSEEVNFSLDSESLKVKADRSNLKLPFFPEEDFVFEIPKEKYACTADIGEDLIRGIEICLTTSSKNTAEEAIMGVCFNFGPKGLTLYSTDGDAVTRYKVDAHCKGVGAFTVPNAFCDALVRTWSETGAQKLAISLNENWTEANLPNWGIRIYGRMIDNPEPLDHATLIKDTIPKGQEPVAIPLGLNEALSRARVVADPETAPTFLVIEKNKLSLFTETHMGVVKDEINIRGHADISSSVHASLVQRSLGACNKIAIHENCTVYIKDEKILQVVSNVGER